MGAADWAELCYDSLGVPGGLAEDERRLRAERALLEAANQPVDILGIGAAEAAIDLVVRYGSAGELSDVLLLWEQAENVPPGLLVLGDEGVERATALAKLLLQEVVALAERGPAEIASVEDEET